MSDEQEWAKIRNVKPSALEKAGSGALRVALLFGSLAIALGLFATPFFDQNSDSRIFANYGTNVDRMTTASIRKTSPESFTIRKSVLQKYPTSECIIQKSGTQTGDC